MASNILTANSIASTYAQLLHIGTGTAGVATIRTGDGTATALSLVSGGAKVTGTWEVTGTLKCGGLVLSPSLGVTAETGVIEPVRVAVLAADFANSTVTPNVITGLSLPVAANGLYQIEAILPATSAATTTGARFQLDGPAEFSWLAARWQQCGSAGLATGANEYIQNVRAWAVGFAPIVAPEVSQPYVTLLTGLVQISGTTPTSNISLSAYSEVATSAINVLKGAILRLTRLA